MKKTIGFIALSVLACGWGLRASAQGPTDEVRAVTVSECQRKTDAQQFGSRYSDRHWFMRRCMTPDADIPWLAPPRRDLIAYLQNCAAADAAHDARAVCPGAFI